MQVPEKLEKAPFVKAPEWGGVAVAPPRAKRSLLRALFSHPLGAVGISLLVCFCLLAYLVPGDKLRETLRLAENQAPCAAHWLGCDALGRDLALRIAHGARMSIELGVAVSCLDMFIGMLWGGLAAFLGRRSGTFLIRFASALHALPLMLMMIVIRNTWKPGWASLLLAMSFFGWIPMARMIYKSLLKRFRPHLSAPLVQTTSLLRRFWARAQGPMLITLSLSIPEAICIEGVLSFLGLGMEPPYYSLGSLASEGLLSIRYYPLHFFAPAIALIWLVLSMHLVAEAIQDFFDEEDQALPSA